MPKYPMHFKEWLMTESIRFVTWASDGTVVALINGKRYRYATDAIHHDRWQRLARFAPGRVLNQIKNLVKTGQATLDAGPY